MGGAHEWVEHMSGWRTGVLLRYRGISLTPHTMDTLANAAEACAVVKMTPAVTPAGLATYAHFAHGDHGDDGGRARCCRPGLRDRGSNACIAAAWKSPFAATSLLSAVLDAITNAFSRPSADAHVITRSPHRSRATFEPEP